MGAVPPDIQKTLSSVIAPGILSMITSVRTTYEDQIEAVRPEVCAEFARKAQQELPKLRDSTEDKLIEEQLSWWLERYRS